MISLNAIIIANIEYLLSDKHYTKFFMLLQLKWTIKDADIPITPFITKETETIGVMLKDIANQIILKYGISLEITIEKNIV